MRLDDVIITPSEGPDHEAAYAEVRGLLEQRNLNQAADRGARLLHDYPDDATAHALMGDIFAARLQWAEAVEWYTRAETLGGGPEVARRRGAAQGMVPRTAAVPAPVAEPFDFHRQRTRVLAISGAAVGVLIVALIIALLAMSSRTPPGQKAPLPPRIAGSGASGAGAPAPGSPPAAPYLAGGASAPAPSAPGAATRSPVPSTGAPARTPGPPLPPHAPVIITRRMDVPATDEDYVISQAVGTLTWPDGTPMSGDVAVMADSYQGYGMITFRIPNNLAGGMLADTVALQAYKVIVATFATDAGMDAVTVRAIATISTTRRDHITLEAFRANLTRKAQEEWRKVIPDPTAQELRDKILSTCWWNPAIPQNSLR